MSGQAEARRETPCYHCGTPANESAPTFDDKTFCCAGCRSVYQILRESELCRYYDFEKTPGNTPSLRPAPRFEFLDDPVVTRQLIDYTDGKVGVITLHVPEMHCSSCIWLLENLHKLDAGIAFSRVDFLKRSLLVRFVHEQTSIRQIITLLSSLGYEPELSLASLQRKKPGDSRRSLYLKIGVAAFSFGNIMLFSLPEYFAASREERASRSLFGLINLLLSLPVVIFSSSLFYVSAWQGLRKRVTNIDLPIALGILVVFLRSAAEVFLALGPGYFDSLTGLVFFLLLGRLFQDKTYDALNFERRYHSYFPLAVAIRKNGTESSVPIVSLRPGDRILIRNNEIIPADSVLMTGSARIDYSFITGESSPVQKVIGELIFAGGKQAGATIELETVKEVSESKFIQLWNDFGSRERIKSRLLTLSTTAGKYFTVGILAVAAVTALTWWVMDPALILDSVSAVLLVACPCALALAAPFAFGTTMRLFGNLGLYLRNSNVVEILSRIDTIVFDKTGTLTETAATSVRFNGDELSGEVRCAVASLARSSTHPLSRAINNFLGSPATIPVADFEEIEGEGLSGSVSGLNIALGSSNFVCRLAPMPPAEAENTRVYVSIGSSVIGFFEFENRYRANAKEVLSALGSRFSLAILSGDRSSESNRLRNLYEGFAEMRFDQKPADKLAYVRELKQSGKKVLMIGDGLNDAGALWESDVAIAVTEKSNTFSPACDAILNAGAFGELARLINFASSSIRVVYWAIALSLIYNLVGLAFAVQGALTPIIAAILMPLSSISVVVFSTMVTRLLARQKGIA